MKRFLYSLPLFVVFVSIFFIVTTGEANAGVLPNGAPCITVPTNVAHSLCSSGFCRSLTQSLPGLPGICTALPKATNCKCDKPNTPGSGENGFRCDFSGTQDMHGWCSRSAEACIQGSSQDVYTNANWDGSGRRVSAVGISCKAKNEDFVPDPPVPPCAVGAKVGGKCTRVVTSLGEIDTDPGKFVTRLFGIILAAAGAIALILILRSGYKIMTARGNPEGIKDGREQLVAAILGLLFLIFSFVILEIIGVDLLRIPSFVATP